MFLVCFLNFFISFKHDFHVDTEIMIEVYSRLSIAEASDYKKVKTAFVNPGRF